MISFTPCILSKSAQSQISHTVIIMSNYTQRDILYLAQCHVNFRITSHVNFAQWHVSGTLYQTRLF
jgi:acetamidase/formamidase